MGQFNEEALMRSFMKAAVMAAVLVSVAVHATAQGKSGKTKGGGGGGGASVSAVVVFQSSHRPVFVDYFRTHAITPAALPPGIAKNLMRGKPLPPGIAKKALPPHIIVVDR